MLRYLRVPAVVLTVLLVTGVAGCADSTDSGAGTEAVVQYVPIEGGCWTLHLAWGQVYRPLSLPAEFQKDGLAVRVELQPYNDYMSVCMRAQVVDILSIHTR